EDSKTFQAGRTISQTDGGGHFIINSLDEVPPAFAFWTPDALSPPASEGWEPGVLMFGLGDFRHTDVYLAYIPANKFWSGEDEDGSSATRYFAGLDHGRPTWSDREADSVPVMID